MIEADLGQQKRAKICIKQQPKHFILWIKQHHTLLLWAFKLRCYQKELMRNSRCFFHKMRRNIVRVELTVEGSKKEKRFYCNIENHKRWDIKENSINAICWMRSSGQYVHMNNAAYNNSTEVTSNDLIN